MSLDLDQAVRVAAALAAIVFFVAPSAAAFARKAYEAMASRAKPVGDMPASTKAVVAILLLYVAAAGAPSLRKPSASSAKPVEVEAPSAEMQKKVAAVREAMKAASPADRAAWADVWTKSAKVAAEDIDSKEPLFADTKTLRAFCAASLEIGWRRLSGNEPGKYPGLRSAVEGAMAEVLSLDSKKASKETLRLYAEVSNAIAWAGTK